MSRGAALWQGCEFAGVQVPFRWNPRCWGRGAPQTMANYTRRNLSQYAQETSMAFFRTWATMVRQPGRDGGSPAAAPRLSGGHLGPVCVVRTGAGPVPAWGGLRRLAAPCSTSLADLGAGPSNCHDSVRLSRSLWWGRCGWPAVHMQPMHRGEVAP